MKAETNLSFLNHGWNFFVNSSSQNEILSYNADLI